MEPQPTKEDGSKIPDHEKNNLKKDLIRKIY